MWAPGHAWSGSLTAVEHPAAVRRRGEEIRLDLAVLELTGEGAPDINEHVRYAIVSQEQAELIERCTGLGFPRFKEDKTRPRPRSGKPLRNIEQLDGEIPAAAGALADLLTFRVTARPREQPLLPAEAAGFGGSAWQGVSGTVVFARDDSRRAGDRGGDRASPVRGRQRADAGTDRRDRRLGSLSAAEQRAWWELLGVPDPDVLPVLPRLSSRRRQRPPAPPRGAVARSRLVAATLAALRDGPAPLVALVGPPGFGKSVLARLVAAAVDAPVGSGVDPNGGELVSEAGWCGWTSARSRTCPGSWLSV